jgi:hypothetical protein
MLRTTFSTSRLLDFFSEKELTAQVGLGSGFGLWAATAQGEMACNVERERQSLPKPVAADSPKPATAVARKRARRPGESFHALRGGRAGSRRSDGDRAAYGLYGVGKKGTRSVCYTRQLVDAACRLLGSSGPSEAGGYSLWAWRWWRGAG